MVLQLILDFDVRLCLSSPQGMFVLCLHGVEWTIFKIGDNFRFSSILIPIYVTHLLQIV